MKLKALFQIFLIVSMSFYVGIVFSTPVVAQSEMVCCSETNIGDVCSYVPRSECKSGALMSPTSCELTSYCKPVCCYGLEDGLCYPRMSKAKCSGFDGVFSDDVTCSSVPQCALGCCIIGTEAAYVTEGRCKEAVKGYTDITMDFRLNVGSEQECIALAKSAKKGCCVTEDSCSYTTQESCTAVMSDTTGFFADKFCEDVGIGACASCGSSQKTGCLPNEESVYKFDTCGNPSAKVLPECDYLAGTLCGDSDGDGKFTCEPITCDKRDVSVGVSDFLGTPEIKKATIRNGESWCMYDSEDMSAGLEPGGKDPVGSRYYRGVCINGKEFIEPCEDYRKEWCVDGEVEFTINGKTESFVEAQCRDNRWQSCIDDCNTADPFTMNSEEYARAAKDDMECCADVTKRDCSWVKNKCVPKASPGFKFWEDDGSDTCSKADMSCSVIMHCPGWNVKTGTCDKGEDVDRWKIAGVTALAVVVGIGGAAFTGGGSIAIAVAGLASGAYVGVKLGTSNWELVHGEKCLTPGYVQAANNLCRSFGDCGAAYSIAGDYTSDGFSVVDSFGSEYDDILKEDYAWPFVKKENRKKGKEYFDLNKPSWDKGKEIFDFTEKEVMGKAFGKSPSKNTWYGRFFGYQAYDTSDREWYRSPFLWHLGASVGAGIAGSVALGPGSRMVGLGTGLQQADPLAAVIGFGYRGLFTKGASFEKLLAREAEAEVFKKAKEVAGEEAIKKAGKERISKVGMEKLGEKGIEKAGKEAIRKSAEEGVRKAAEQLGEDAFEKTLMEAIQTKTTEKTLQLATEAKKEAIQKALKEAGDEAVKKASESAIKEASQGAIKEAGEKIIKEGAMKSYETWAGGLAHGLSVASWVMLAYDIGDIVFDQTKQLEVSTTCTPWVAPQVKEDDQCEKCNPDYKDYVKDGEPINFKGFLDCSEYRCKSFGASCDLINEGTEEEKCVSISERDVNAPVIEPWTEELKKFDLIPKDSKKEGVILKYTGTECPNCKEDELPIYKSFVISLKTEEEPAQCKMSTELGKSYEEMGDIWFGGPNYQYYHTQFMQFKSPGVDGESTALSGGGLKKFYIKCIDASGNANEADYVVQFRVTSEPDLTAPRIEKVVAESKEIVSDVFLTAGAGEVEVSLAVNEEATCKWDFVDESYDGMKNNVCKTQGVDSLGMYPCVFNHPGEGSALPYGPVIKTSAQPGESKFVYFKCQDQSPNKNKARQSKVLTLHGSDSLVIDSVKPEGQMYIREELGNVILEVQTSGGAHLNGDAVCGYLDVTDREGYENAVPPSIQEFYETEGSVHKQTLNLAGTYTYHIGCVDEAGNKAVARTTFTIEKDSVPPEIIRAYRDRSVAPVMFRLELDEEGSCQYSDSLFSFGEGIDFLGEGTMFSAEVEGSEIYVICKDVYGNQFDAVKVSFLS